MQVEIGEIWSGYAREGLDIKDENLKFYNVKKAPFKIYGLADLSEGYRRVPAEIAEKAPGIKAHAVCSTGVRVRFCTDSKCVGIRAKFNRHVLPSPHVTRLAETGFDIYVDEDGTDTYKGSYYPAKDGFDGYEGIKYFDDNAVRCITIYFPIGNHVIDLEVALEEKATLKEPYPYKYEKPVAFYGSSITHGFAASRPGTTYVNRIGRMLNTDILNFGFSGSAKGESTLAEYFAGIDMSVFVLDYDHNAPDVQHLKNTHYAFYEIIRKAKPELPIIFVTKPDAKTHTEEKALVRKDVIMKNYLTARENGDKNIYFIDGNAFFVGGDRMDYTADGCHPNDLGASRMAEYIGAVIGEILKR
ncbi:MAG: SGNH/GDSL hydrolase family protein [Acutalibacteraceae bacterium]|nr:SGNH/GDSL hydrolase family protein [Acutalibacteraceae bacterium]